MARVQDIVTATRTFTSVDLTRQYTGRVALIKGDAVRLVWPVNSPSHPTRQIGMTVLTTEITTVHPAGATPTMGMAIPSA